MLYRGVKGPEVRNLQNRLNELGWEFEATGRFDLETEAAVRGFQRENNLTKDGIVGPRTSTALETATSLPGRKKPVRLLVECPYYSQRDNVYVPSGTCNVTSLAMVLASLGLKPSNKDVQLEDELFTKLNTEEARAYFESKYPNLKKQGYNPRNVHGMLAWLALQYGFTDIFSARTYRHEIDTHLRKGIPVILSGQFTASGHIVVLLGFTADGDYIFNDPWGNWEHGYRTGTNGERVIYNMEDVNAVIKGGTNPPASGLKLWAHRISKKNNDG